MRSEEKKFVYVLKMADITRAKKKRSANKNVVLGLIVKSKDLMIEEFNEEIREELETFIRTIEIKEQIIKGLDNDIIDMIDEDHIDEDVEVATQFEIKVGKALLTLKKFLKKHGNEKDSEISFPSSSSRVTGVKLPKIFIKKFNGDPINWQQFSDTFEATVHKNESLSNIEKFTYLKGYIEGPAAQCIEGIMLSNDNYKEARDLLTERYGNPQLITSSHMNKLIKIEKVISVHNIKELRNLHDKVESHVRSLIAIGINSEHYGALLIPIILDKLPDDIRLVISRKLGKETWKIEEFMKILKDEITARENCDFSKSQFHKTDKTEYESKGERKRFTTETFFTGNRTLKPCAFCKQNHYHDQCSVVTDFNARKEIVWKNKLCFKCLTPGHSKRECRNKNKCYRCKSYNHHTAICDKEERQESHIGNEKSTGVNIVNSKTSVLLQTASGIISDTKESRNLTVKILLDSGSQRTYMSQRVVKALNLKPVNSQEMNIKTFGSKFEKNR